MYIDFDIRIKLIFVMGKMLKFENPSRFSSFKCSTLPLDRPSHLSLMRRKLRPSVTEEAARRQDPLDTALTGLPVPTVPPYPIEMFESGCGLGITNRAFNLTDECLTDNSKTTVPVTATVEALTTPDKADIHSGRPSPEGAVYTISATLEEAVPSDETFQFSRPYVNCALDEGASGSGSGSSASTDSLVKCGSSKNVQELVKGGAPSNAVSQSVRTSVQDSKPVMDCTQIPSDGSLVKRGSNNSPLVEGGSLTKDAHFHSDSLPNGSSPCHVGSLLNGSPLRDSGPLANAGLLCSSGPHLNGGPLYSGGPLPSDSLLRIGRPLLNCDPLRSGGPRLNGGLFRSGGSLPNGGPLLNGGLLRNSCRQSNSSLRNRGPVNCTSRPNAGFFPGGNMPDRRVISGRPVVKSASLSESETTTTTHANLRSNGGPVDIPRSLRHTHYTRHTSSYPDGDVKLARGPPSLHTVGRPSLENVGAAVGNIGGATAARHSSRVINHNPTARIPNVPVDSHNTNKPSDGSVSRSFSSSISESMRNRLLDPIYSKVCKPKAPRNKLQGKDEDHKTVCEMSKNALTHHRMPSEASRYEKKEGLDNSSSCYLQPKVLQKRSSEEATSQVADDVCPLYEDVKEFEDDRPEERQYNIEVKIDYSRGSKYQMETRHVVRTKNKSGDNTRVINNPDVQKTKNTSEARKEKAISKKLRKVGEMKSFKLGVIHVIRVGKWRFVALCCCGNTNRYVHQPGRIEDYIPGYSSLSEKELKKSQSQEPPPVSVNHRYGSQKMSMTHALKESGYESDSTLVFRKREDARRQAPDPRKTSQVYRQIQRGGDIPFTGLQKTNPPKPRDDYYVVYSDLDLGLHHPSLSDLTPSCGVTRTMSPPPKPPMPTFGERKRTAPSKVVLAPSPPRRISSKWHPSLIKSNKDQPPVPSARSASAERVRETRALYSSWHREKVARSREKIGTSPARNSSLGRSLSAAKQTQEARENFLKGRRTVSESRFTIEDRENSPPRRSASSPKSASPTRQSEIREKLQYRSSQRDRLGDKSWASKHDVQDHTPVQTRGHNRSLSADSTRKWSNTSTESGRCSVMRHTVSSMNKIKRPSLHHNQTDNICPELRSSSAESNCRRMRSGYISPEPQISSRKSPVGRKDSRYRGSPYSDVSIEVSDDKKLKQSESFDTTQSNETGYSSMLDLSTSPTPEKKAHEDRERRTRKKSEPQQRPHSVPVRRTRISTSFHEQRSKWEALTRGEIVSGRQSRSPSRCTSPLRSLQLVRQVSSSFKDIPVEVWSAGTRRSKSLDVLTPSPHSHPNRYRQYILELRNAAPRNARISQLRRLFTSLDRVHRLERSVSSVELSAAQNRAYEIIDFETWKGMREKERKALEYSVLLKELNVAQKEREFLYKVTPDTKWSGDCRLRGRDISVPELCEKFDTTSDNTSEITQKRRRELENNKDTYRGLWRGSSVRDLSQMYQSSERHRSSRRGSSLSLSREDSSMRARGLWTSLSLEQVNAFRDHLTEIYGSMQSIRSWRERKQMSSDRAQNRSHRELSKYSVDVAETGRAIADKLRTLHVRPPSESSQKYPVRLASPPRTKKASSLNQVEDERRQLSKQLSIELHEKVLEQRSGRSLETPSGAMSSLQVPDVPLSISPESLSRSSPRTCYSLDISDSSEPNSLNSGDQFLLVVQKPGRSGRSQSLPPEPVSDPETSDSEVSVRTVVHKDVAGKVKFFEKRARRNSRSSERQSSCGSRLNIDEVPHYATLPSRLKQQSQSKLLSPNYLPERSVSSVNLTSKADVASQAWQIYDKTNPLSGSSVQPLADTFREKTEGDPTSRSRSYLYHVKTGDVSRLRSRYESPEDARRRAKSLPDVNGPLSRVTPTGKTVIRGQEAGDVQYIRAKYEAPRRSRSPEHWQPTRDEYLPKSKLTSTLQSLAARSPAFSEPNTIERLARRDSVEKAVLRRVYTGNVEASVDRLENKRFDSGSRVSIIGQMYTSAPSVNELATMAPLVPPRPPPPLLGPQKPQRLGRTNPQPLLTSTPTPSPGDARAAHKQRALQVPEPVCPPPIAVHPPPGMSNTFSHLSTHYNADAHRPKSRYIPPESYGTSMPKSYGQAGPTWTQSLERPHRVTRAMSHTSPPPSSHQGAHCYTLRHHHSRPQQPPPPPLPKSSSVDHHTYSQPYSYTQPCSHTTRPHHHHSYYHSHSQGREQSCSSSKAVSWKESPYKYESGEVNIHYRTPVRIEQKEAIPEEELARRQEEHMKKVYENERRKKYLAELEDIERRRHTDNFTPLQKSPIPLNRYDDESSLGTMRGARTPDLKQVAKSLYNFTAQNKRELSFNKGEVIFIRRQIDKNWYEGELRGSVGIFPCNYVEIVPYESIKTLTRKPTEGQARARFNFQAQTSMEMSLSKGELVVLTRRVDENWYEGRIGNRKGIFPVSYVDTLVEPGSDRPMTPSSSPMPRPALPAANLLYNGASSYSSPYSTLGRPGSQNDSRPYNQSLTVNTQQEPVAYRALYNYKPQNDDELELLESDVVMVMEKCDDGWFVGTSRRTGLFGTFPGNYVERV
ncbi:uncharacterized protein [Cherax quadricarinatus]|uniref:uncharacterized protein isoform X17 n=1 Tax=Cherax quadricarinatus TaxID=27406 RepID=UPI00387ED650